MHRISRCLEHRQTDGGVQTRLLDVRIEWWSPLEFPSWQVAFMFDRRVDSVAFEDERKRFCGSSPFVRTFG